MKLATVLKLIDAGYTREEINAMEVDETVEAPKEETKTESPAEAPEASNDSELLKEIKALRNALNLKNIHTDQKESPEKPTAEDILISLLNGKEK